MSNIRYFLEAQDAQKPQGKLHYISVAKYDADWHSMPHTHNHTELFYVVSGRGNFSVDGRAFPVEEDDVIIVNPGARHTEVSVPGNPLEYIVLGIEGMEFSTALADGAYVAGHCRPQKQELRFYLGELVREAQEQGEGYAAACQHLYELVILKVARSTGQLLSGVETHKTNRECEVAKRYLDMNFKENITLESLAKLTHINKYYLAHAFRKYTGTSPISYLIARRVKESRGLLETTDYSISQVAGITGFSSQSYFSQIFRKYTGETPNEYRKRVKRQQKEEQKREES